MCVAHITCEVNAFVLADEMTGSTLSSEEKEKLVDKLNCRALHHLKPMQVILQLTPIHNSLPLHFDR